MTSRLNLVGMGAVALSSMLMLPVAAGALDGTEPVSTVAGGNGQGSDSNQLHSPDAVAIGPDDSVYVTDSDNHRVIRVTPAGERTVVAGGLGAGSGTSYLNTPSGVAVDAAGNIYVADTANHRVQRIAAIGGGITTVAGGLGAGPGSDQLHAPTSIVVAADGTLYIADNNNYRIQKVETDGDVTTVAGTAGHGEDLNQLKVATGMELDSAGNLIVADTRNNRILKVTPAGVISVVASGTWGSGFYYPQGIAIDEAGSIYTVESSEDRVLRIDPDGSKTEINDDVSDAVDLAFDGDGSLFVADTGNNRVRKLTPPDVTDPVITISTPAGIELGDSIDFSCSDEGTTDLESCDATLDGVAISSGYQTVSAGTAVLVVSASDGAENTARETITFTITDPNAVVETPGPGPRELTGGFSGVSGMDGSAARLYLAVFGRQPDAVGHSYWVARTKSGVSLNEVAAYFVTSDEFVQTYSSLGDQAFVDLLYRNVMNRQGDVAGRQYWYEQLSAGLERSTVVLQFSESPEFKALTGSN